MTTLDLKQGLSIVIPFYNEGSNTRKSIEAIFEASASAMFPFEVIAVDDGSTDNFSQNNLPEKTIFIKKNHSGRLETRLRGMDAAKFQNVLFIDARVWVDRDSLINLQLLIEENPESRFWNGHVLLNSTSPINTIWETLVGVGWKRIARNETTKYGLSDFDRYPKGTGFFLANKSDWLEAFAKIQKNDNSNVPISDDTRLLREFAKKDEIWLSGKVSAKYFGRATFRGFLKNSYYRGQTFVDSYWKSPTVFGKLVRSSLPLGIGLASASVFLEGVKGGILLGFSIVLLSSASFFLYSLKSWKSYSRACKESALIIPLLLIFGAGFVKAYLLGFRSRLNSEE
jgi:glycosyltransferase involved in cell wall biosynthesis